MRVRSHAVGAAAAVAFLTRVPLGRFIDVDGAAIRRGAPIHPLVGAGVGAAAGVLCDLVAGPLPDAAAGAAGIGAAALLTGAMHLDALADTADALGGTTRERRLEIMRDHAVGAFGVTALATIILFEAALLASLAATGDAWRAFAIAGACSRWAPLPIAAVLPYARTSGQGAALADLSWPAVAAALVLAAGVCALAGGVEGGFALAAAASVAVLSGAFFQRALGGVTGDALGATTELAQAAALAALVVAW